MRGFLVTFEGIEGAGKSTLLKLTEEYLRKRGYSVFSTFEPGDTELGRRIRELLLDPSKEAPSAEAELLLYLADRAEHVQKRLIPALRDYRVVLCDRFSDSTIAYQGYGRGLDIDTLLRLDHYAREGLTPDLTILLDLDPEEGLRRNDRLGKGDRFERETIEFHRRVREGFLQIANRDPQRVKVIDASQPVEEVFSLTKHYLEVLLNG
jgi:dTMP kinase